MFLLLGKSPEEGYNNHKNATKKKLFSISVILAILYLAPIYICTYILRPGGWVETLIRKELHGHGHMGCTCTPHVIKCPYHSISTAWGVQLEVSLLIL